MTLPPTARKLLARAREHVAFRLDPRIDRYILEKVVFAALSADKSVRDILFVGCDWYTRDYPRRFTDAVLQTIDIDPAKARFGSPDHLVGSIVDLGDLVAADAFDAIVCSGVLGFGLQDPDETEAALQACRRALRPGGWLVLGWNDVDDLRPFDIDRLGALRCFERCPLPPFPTFRYPTFSPARHTFDFYRRPRPDHRSTEERPTP